MSFTKQELQMLRVINDGAIRLAASNQEEGVSPDDLVNCGVMKRRLLEEIKVFEDMEAEVAEARRKEAAEAAEADKAKAGKRGGRTRAVKKVAATKRTGARSAA